MMTIDRSSAFARTATLGIGLAVTLSACDILDVNNPNNLLEDDVRQPAAANAMVNGALAAVSVAISRMWQPIAVSSDEMVWIGSRDAWQQLDFGFLSDPYNEFVDENFPFIGRARWLADQAEAILQEHVQTTPTDRMRTDLARAHLFAGIMYTVLGETQQDFVFSDKTEAAPPIGADRMNTVLDQAIEKLDRAVALAGQLGNADLETRALAMRARARHSRAMWDKVKPTPSPGNPLVGSPAAVSDAQAVLNRVNDDWAYQLTYSAGTAANNMANWVNSRAENQFDTLSVVFVNQATVKQIDSVRLRDPIDNIPDPVITAKLMEWKGGTISAAGGDYPPLTLASARMMRLIIAEDALQRGDQAAFETQINAIRAMDGLTAYSGQITALDILKHERRVNLFLMGTRLMDMYRFGIQDPHWRPNSDAMSQPGTLMPITIIEIRANPHLQGQG